MADTGALGTDPKPGSLAKPFLTHSGSFLRQRAMGFSNKVPSPSHRISHHAHHPPLPHPVPPVGSCSGHTQASQGLCTGCFLCLEFCAMDSVDDRASRSVLPGRGLAGRLLQPQHTQSFSPLLLAPPPPSYHQPAACISDWLVSVS